MAFYAVKVIQVRQYLMLKEIPGKLSPELQAEAEEAVTRYVRTGEAVPYAVDVTVKSVLVDPESPAKSILVDPEAVTAKE